MIARGVLCVFRTVVRYLTNTMIRHVTPITKGQPTSFSRGHWGGDRRPIRCFGREDADPPGRRSGSRCAAEMRGKQPCRTSCRRHWTWLGLNRAAEIGRGRPPLGWCPQGRAAGPPARPDARPTRSPTRGNARTGASSRSGPSGPCRRAGEWSAGDVRGAPDQQLRRGAADRGREHGASRPADPRRHPASGRGGRLGDQAGGRPGDLHRPPSGRVGGRTVARRYFRWSTSSAAMPLYVPGVSACSRAAASSPRPSPATNSFIRAASTRWPRVSSLSRS